MSTHSETVPTVHLLEPYRSALLSMGYDEGLVTVDGDGARHSASLDAGRRPELRDDVLQLLFVFGQASIAWTETSTAPEFAGAPMLHKRGLGLQTAGIAQLLRDPELENAAAASLKGARSLADVWRPFADEVEAFAPLISSQLAARGKPVSEGLVQFILAVRRGDSETAQRVSEGLPADEREAVPAIQAELPFAIVRYEMPVLSELHQCLFAAKRANSHNATIAGPQIGATAPLQRNAGEASAARKLLAVVAEEILHQNLVLPLPRNLRDAVELRGRQGVSEFRSVFFPWLSRLLQDEASEEPRLRREVQGMLRAARWGPRVRRLSKFVQYVGVASDVASAAAIGAGPPGVGLVITALSGGAEKLAARLESKSRWLLCASAGADQVKRGR